MATRRVTDDNHAAQADRQQDAPGSLQNGAKFRRLRLAFRPTAET